MLSALAQSYQELTELHELLIGKCEGVERLLAEHHGAKKVTEEQIEGCPTCAPLLKVSAVKEAV